MRGEQAIFNLEIKKKDSKVFSSGPLVYVMQLKSFKIDGDVKNIFQIYHFYQIK